VQRSQLEEDALDKRMQDICEGLVEGIKREVETLRREGFPIYVAENGRIIDLQKVDQSNDHEG